MSAPPPSAAADASVAFGPHDIHSAFYVEKSENQNQVHYALHLDGSCHPQGKLPVYAYWMRLKKGVWDDDPLIGAAVRVYGASNEQTVQVTPTGGHVQMYVKALKRVPIDIIIEQSKNGGCVAKPLVTLHNERVKLLRAFLQLGRFGMTVKYVDVFGQREQDSKQVTEQFR